MQPQDETVDIVIDIQEECKIIIDLNTRRDRYRVFSKEEKDDAILQLGVNPSPLDYRRVSQAFGTTIKNLKRWKKFGTERKKGCGRKKLNPEAEQQLIDWALEIVRKTGKKISRQQLQKKALDLFKDTRFCASKGFLDKFVRCHQLKDKMINTLQGMKKLNFHQKKILKQKMLQEKLERMELKKEEEIKMESEPCNVFVITS